MSVDVQASEYNRPPTDGMERSLPWKHFSRGLDSLLLFLLGLGLLLTNRWFTAVDDECAIIDRAAQPFFEIVRLYILGAGEHEHPPLYDLILHGWLLLTRGEQHLLRLPGIIFYLAGAWVLASAAKRQAGNAARTYTLLLIILWPFGFHFGRLAAWYSFCFLLVSVMTWSYFRYLDHPGPSQWIRLVACSLLLVYSNYFGWVLLGCLAGDFIIRKRQMTAKTWSGLAATGLLLLTLYLPVIKPFLQEIHGGIQPSAHILKPVLGGIYDLYCVFVSESVAPWFWILGVPVAAAIAACLATTFGILRGEPRWFLLYFAGLLTIMAVFGIADTKRMLFISPWLIMPVAAALAQNERRAQLRRRVLAASLVFIAAAGWYGILSRNLYAAPHWVEPWEKIANDAGTIARNGGVIIGNNPSFFFYLTYDLAPTGNESVKNFAGLLPDSTRRTNVYSAPQWLEKGRPLAPRIILVKGAHFQIPSAPMDEAEQWLRGECILSNSERAVQDRGAEVKDRFAPETGQLPWRIEIITFQCP